ncbi:MAG: hypothetical protein IKI65_03245 [Firmicutes bacterium]|nr:hypothetical protein [Bacillota bacterium]
MKISFGTDDKKRLTGTGTYVKVFQVSSLVLACCMLLASQFPPVMLKRGLFSALFDLAAMSLPRAWVWLLSCIYRASSKETILFFALLVLALALDIAFRKISARSPKAAENIRKAFAVLIAADLVIRLLPFSFNSEFSFITNAAGFVVRLACLVLIVLDLRKK